MTKRLFAFDTETELIVDNNIPPVICLSYATEDDKVGVAVGEQIPQIIEAVVSRGDTLIAHNASFDLGVLVRAFPQLWTPLSTALQEDRVVCTKIRERLYKIARGGSGDGAVLLPSGERVGKLSLAGLINKYCDVDIGASKQEDSVRYKYSELREVAVEEWPEEAVRYAILDSVYALQVYWAQERTIAADVLSNQYDQVRADFALYIMGAEGIPLDSSQIDAVKAGLEADLEPLKDRLESAGLMEKGSIKTSALSERIQRAYQRIGQPAPKTEKGAVSTSKQSIQESQDADLLDVIEWKERQKLLSTYVPALQASAEIDNRVRTRYDVLKVTGRTSSSSPNIQNLPRKGGVRDCFVADPGNLLVLCDYEAAEMRTLCTAYRFATGESSPLEQMYREDPHFDAHTWFASRLIDITYEEGKERKSNKDKRFLERRQQAKAANFGFPGGLGAAAFQQYARGYGLDLSVEEAHNLRENWIDIWRFSPYFEACNDFAERGYVETPGSLRRRGFASFTESCNYLFSSLLADAAKRAVYRVVIECFADPESALFGARPVAFIHDEIIIQAPKESAPTAGARLSEIMVEELEAVTGIPAIAEPALCRYWAKGAEPVYNEDGKLIPWEPSA
jgi:DNA polymerase I-like protein with 3'-5' exonuclease and polymerase domains